ncbi:MAG: transcriptional repressor [Anaerolineae bacterium]|nr:transcriptional repressor [Anaerolineae bacterium]
MSELDQVRQAGERLTRQRRAVLQALDTQGGHVTAEQLCDALRGEFPHINTGTVYRILQWLKGHSLVSETDVGIGVKVYERVCNPRHHHLVCLNCHRTIDVDDRYFHPLATALKQDLGFQARIEHFAVFGYCADCARGK